MVYVGMLVILASLIAGAWYVISGRPRPVLASSFTFLAIFVGIFFVVYERATEITITGVGTIKAAAKSAEGDAAAIAKVLTRVEAQSATIDLVAAKATEAEKLSKELDRLVKFSTTILAARADDRQAFDRLLGYANEKSDLSRIAGDAYVGLRATYGGALKPGFLNFPTPSDLASVAPSKIREFYSALPSTLHAHAIQIIWKREDIPKNDRLELLASVLQSDPSLSATYYAGKFLAADSKLTWEPFKTQELLSQWREDR